MASLAHDLSAISSPPSTSHGTDFIQLYEALGELVDLGLSRNDILSLSRSGTAADHKVLDILQNEDQQKTDSLLRSLKGVPEDSIHGWLDVIAGKKSKGVSGRPLLPLPLRDVTDPTHTIASNTPFPQLLPPLRHSSISELSSTSTELTHPSSQKKLNVLIYCPQCGICIKSGFEKHFYEHLPDLFYGFIPNEIELIGCGYCPCDNLSLDYGKVFYGQTAFLLHVHEEHAQSNSPNPGRLPWEFNASFKNIIFGQRNIRQHFIDLIKKETAEPEASPATLRTLSWVASDTTRHLLSELQMLGGKIGDVPFFQLRLEDQAMLHNLLRKVCKATFIPPRTISSQNPSQQSNQWQHQPTQSQHLEQRPLNIATTSYENQGRRDTTEELEAEMMKMKEEFGDDHPTMLSHMDNLVSRYKNQGRWDAAEDLQLRVIKMRAETLGIDDPDMLSEMAILAQIYAGQHRWNSAEELQVKVMDMSKKKLGADHPDTLSSMVNLASTYCGQGRWDTAEQLQVQVVKIRKEQFGAHHPDTLSSMAILALIYKNQGRWDDAEELQAQVTEIRKEHLGEHHPDTLSSMAILALIYKTQGRWGAAEELHMKVAEKRTELLGGDYPDTLSSMATLALMYRDRGRLEEAEELGAKVMGTYKRKLGVDHPSTLSSMANLALTYKNQGRLEAAEELQINVMRIREKNFGIGHPITLFSMANLALIYRDQGRFEDAEDLEGKLMEIGKKNLGVDHPDVLSIMTNIAIAWKAQGRYADAINLMRESLHHQQRVLGIDHSDSKYSLATLLQWESEEIKELGDIHTVGASPDLEKDNLQAFASSEPRVAVLQNDSQHSNSDEFQLPFKDVELIKYKKTGLEDQKAGEESQEVSTWIRKSTLRIPFLYYGFGWLKKLLRPKVKEGYRRIEWQCDCGVEIYADFPRSHGAYIDKLSSSLQGPRPISSCSIPSAVGSLQETSSTSRPKSYSDESPAMTNTDSENPEDSSTRPLEKDYEKDDYQRWKGQDKRDQNNRDSNKKDKDRKVKSLATAQSFLALCVNKGGIYKTLSEISMAGISSDAALFLEMKKEYLAKRGSWSRFTYLIKPMTVEFVKFRLWNFKHSYISVYERPNCMPPADCPDYEFQPKSLTPPPMPPEVFIHYLEHGEGDLNPNRNDWLGPLPKRLKKHEWDCEGYGIHVIEGPHRLGIFAITMAVLLFDITFSVMWSISTKDVQGGTGIGALFMACYTAFLTAWIYWRSGP